MVNFVVEQCTILKNGMNIIIPKNGKYFLPPNPAKYVEVKLLVTEQGRTYIHGSGKKIQLGFITADYVETLTDEQPIYAYIPRKDRWFILTTGNQVMYNYLGSGNPEFGLLDVPKKEKFWRKFWKFFGFY